MEEIEMGNKVIPSLFLLMIAMSFFAVALAPAYSNSRTLSAADFEAFKGKPSKAGPPSKGIASGIVSDPPPATNRWAVIIGISDYAGDEYDLEYCDDDAWDFYNALINKYGWLPDHIIILIDDQATKANILDAINWMRINEGPGDEVVFFYSGHGSVSTSNADNDPERKDECIIPWEIQPEYYIWDGDLQEEFSTFESTRIFFYFGWND